MLDYVCMDYEFSYYYCYIYKQITDSYSNDLMHLMIMKYPLVICVNNCKASSRTGSGCEADTGCRVPSASTANCGITYRMHSLTSHEVVVETEPPSPSTKDVFKLSVNGVWVPDNTGVIIPGERWSDPIGSDLFAPTDSASDVDKCDEFSDARWEGRTGSTMWQTSSNGDGVETMQPRHVKQATRIFGSAITKPQSQTKTSPTTSPHLNVIFIDNTSVQNTPWWQLQLLITVKTLQHLDSTHSQNTSSELGPMPKG